MVCAVLGAARDVPAALAVPDALAAIGAALVAVLSCMVCVFVCVYVCICAHVCGYVLWCACCVICVLCNVCVCVQTRWTAIQPALNTSHDCVCV